MILSLIALPLRLALTAAGMALKTLLVVGGLLLHPWLIVLLVAGAVGWLFIH